MLPKIKHLKHQKTFKVNPFLSSGGFYHKHTKLLRKSILWQCVVSRYQHTTTKDYFYRLHGKYWLFVMDDKIYSGDLKHLMAQYWKLINRPNIL